MLTATWRNNMKKKYEILNFNLKELDLLEKHLNNMAKEH